MKRTKHISLQRMQKANLIKPLVVGISAASLMACTEQEAVSIVGSVDECLETTSYTQAQCQAAYEKALEEAARTGPRYSSMKDCAAEFGAENCERHSGYGNSWFMPAMTGFLIGQAISRSYDPYRSYNPVYTYSGWGRNRDKLITADGSVIGNRNDKLKQLPKSTLEKKPTVTRTMSRGGFGSKAAAKSSWGKSASRSWGG